MTLEQVKFPNGLDTSKINKIKARPIIGGFWAIEFYSIDGTLLDGVCPFESKEEVEIQIRRYIQCLIRESGRSCYDPQTGLDAGGIQ